MRMGIPATKETGSAAEQDDLSTRHWLHGAAILVVAVLDGKDHLRFPRGDSLPRLVRRPPRAVPLCPCALSHAVGVDLPAQQQNASIGHSGRLAHCSHVMRQRVFFPLCLTFLPRDAVGPVAHIDTSTGNLDLSNFVIFIVDNMHTIMIFSHNFTMIIIKKTHTKVEGDPGIKETVK